MASTMYRMRPYFETSDDVTPASIMYKLRNIHRSLSNHLENNHAPKGPSHSESAPLASLTNGNCSPNGNNNHCTEDEQKIKTTEEAQTKLLARVKKLSYKLDSLVVDSKKAGKTAKRPLTPEEPVPQVPVVDYNKSRSSVIKELHGDGTHVELVLLLSPSMAGGSRWLRAIRSVLRNRYGRLSMAVYRHSSVGADFDISSDELPIEQHHQPTITVRCIFKEAVFAAACLRVDKVAHGPIFGEVAIWKLLGRLAGVYPCGDDDVQQRCATATQIDWWLQTAVDLTAANKHRRQAILKEVDGRFAAEQYMLLPAESALTLADVCMYGVLSCCDERDCLPPNVKRWYRVCAAAFGCC